MPNIQNYQSINSDIENINSESNIDIIYDNIRWNASKISPKLCYIWCYML